MIRLIKAAYRGVRNELAAGESGWINLSDSKTWSSTGIISNAGETVNADNAMKLSAAFDCVKKTSEVVGSLPLAQFDKQPDQSMVQVADDLSDILTVSPNSEQTPLEFWEGNVANMVLRGNAYNERIYLGKHLVALKPIPSCTPEKMANGKFRYAVIDRGKIEYLPADKVFHLRGFGAGDGLGLSAIQYGANSLGAALAADKSSSSIFSNSMQPSGVLQSEQTLSEPQRAQLQTMLSAFTGSAKAGKIMALEAGLTFSQLQMNPEDAQLLETRRFSVEDVCRWFGVPPIIIGHSSDGQTMWGTGVEQIFIAWRSLGINPILNRIQERIRKDLIAPEHRRKRCFKYNREAMLEMDSKAKGEYLSKMGMSGTMTANERREKLNLPRHKDPQADSLLAQSAMEPLELLGKDKKP